jgi:hypothetical protein
VRQCAKSAPLRTISNFLLIDAAEFITHRDLGRLLEKNFDFLIWIKTKHFSASKVHRRN